MTTNELRETANRVRNVPPHIEICSAVFRDIIGLANAWLAEHPEDDEQPVDEAWLRSVGFDGNLDPDMKMTIRPPLFGRAFHYLRHTQVSFIHGQWFANGMGCEQCKTRGDVRRLCRALGIELKENESPNTKGV